MEEENKNKTEIMEEESKKKTEGIEEESKKKTQSDTKKSKSRMLMVIAFIILFSIISYVFLRGSYLEYKELGENYVQEFFTNLKYKYTIMGINFILLYVFMYFTNRGIKKGLKEFFDKENKLMPKLPNKSIALVISVVVSAFMSSVLMQKIILCASNSSFGMTDPIFNMDIGYFMFQKPLISTLLIYIIAIVIGSTVYMALYYIITFNIYFDGIDGKMLRKSLFMKKLTRNVMIIAILIGLNTLLGTQNILYNTMTTIENSETSRLDGTTGNIEITGASYTDVVIQRWGYTIFAFIIVFCIWMAVRYFKKQDTAKILKYLSVIPIYLVGLFIVMIGFNLIFVNSNKLDKEKKYLEYNIENTKNAYKINVEEANLENSGTITEQEVKQNTSVIYNIPLITEDIVLKTLGDNQTGTGYYSYHDANIAKYKIDGSNKLVYVAPREIANSGRTYNNKTYEYTHGMGQIVASATDVTESGTIQYIQKEVSGQDDKLGTNEQRIYFGLETNNTIATNTKNKQEYDYTDETGKEYTSTYDGQAGLTLSFLDRLILAITKGDINLAFSSEVTQNSKILINRNIIDRAKKAMPYLIYDEEPYTVVTDDGKIVWVLDAYTVSSNYPYSQYTTIEHDGKKEKINYIRNSVKVIIDSYDGTLDYYITDKTDPIAMAYKNTYPQIFKEEIPEDIANHFIYPKYLYNVQAELLKTYHNVKADVLYRADDIWDFAKYNSTKVAKSTGSILEPYYTMVKTEGEEKLGLVQIYTPNEKQNIISYLTGSTENGTNQLKLYKFSEDSNIVGPMQLEKQIEQDEVISAEIESLNTTGAKVTKNMIIVPINQTLLYVEPIYQTMLNESQIPVLKKVIVASGNKVTIGDTLEKALENLLSKNAVDIEVENTEDLEGLIEAIIKANKNLTESNGNQDWEMMGKDIKKLQTLIESLEQVKTEEDKKKEGLEEEQKQDNNTVTNNKTGSDKINFADF